MAFVEGDNLLEIRATSADGSMESEPARLRLHYDKPLDKPHLYLLAVGINHYPQETLNLKFAAADAQAMAGIFERRGPQLYRQVHAHCLLNEQATKSNILHALEGIAQQARPQDTLVIFLAGHGTTIGQRYYFIPHEFQAADGKPLGEEIRRQGLPADELGDCVRKVPALKRLLIYDTCQSGGAVALSRTARDPFAFRGAIERLSRAEGLFTIAAAAAGEEAQEVAELGHGILTYTLLAGLQAIDRGPLHGQGLRPGNKERTADVLEWFRFASDQVPRLTKQYYGRAQDVEMSNQGRNFPVLPVDGP